MKEVDARRVTLVEAFDAADSPLWTPEDRRWATRLAAQTAPPDAHAERWAIERAHHALERLRPRDPAIRQWLANTGWRWTWWLAATVLGLVLGLTADLIGQGRYIDLLAPTLWLIVAWNLAIYAVLALDSLRGSPQAAGWFRRLLSAAWDRGAGTGPLQDATRRWVQRSAVLTASRTAVLVHLVAAFLGIGMICGLYLRGLVFDFRAAWQSTFLDGAMVDAVLQVLLKPAQLATGLPLPAAEAIEAMRLTPASPEPMASAALWIHLYAATLLLFVVLPRLSLAALSMVRAFVRARHLTIAVEASEISQFARWHRGGSTPLVQVLPYAQVPGAQAALGLRELLAAELGEDVVVRMADVTAVGDEDAAVARAGAAGIALKTALVDLGATPEDEHHGRFLNAVMQAPSSAPTVLLVDEAAYRIRFGGLPGRLQERKAAWLSFADRHGLRAAVVNLDQPQQDEAREALRQALAP